MDPAITRELHVDADPDAVWEALTDPALLTRWLADEVELEPVEGGHVATRDRSGRGRSGVVERVAEPRELALRWRDDAGFESTVEITVDALARGSLVTVVERAAWNPVGAAMAATGWGMALALLARAARVALVA